MLTAEQLIELTLKPGAVYKYPDEEALNSNKEPHYFILINNTPTTDKILLFVCVSSKVEKAKKRATRRGQKQETLVELNKNDYDFLTDNSIIDCNNISKRDRDWIIEKAKEEKFEVEKEVDEKKLKQIQDAFLLSKKHDKAIKRIVNKDLK
jgi:hypothetical protein